MPRDKKGRRLRAVSPRRAEAAELRLNVLDMVRDAEAERRP